MSSTGAAQRRALDHVASASVGDPVDRALRVTLNFHPDRQVRGVPILEQMVRDDLYRSQFETGTSNGGLTAHPGGDRWRWESRIFGGAYDNAAPSERPKYGALNYRGSNTGGSPRFGSAHVRLNEAALHRTTFCFPDSVFDPVHFGVAAKMSLIALAEATDQDPLDDYVEAQVHGPIRFSEDVEALVLDPCYRGTRTEDLARRLPCQVKWHEGFRLTVQDLQRHPDYRGPEIVALGEKLSRDGYLDARLLGEASNLGEHDPQALKRVWHYVARFGSSLSREPGSINA